METGVTGTLTDGTGVSKLVASKFVKDLVLDLLLALPAVFVAVNVANLEQAVAAPTAVAFGLADAIIRWLYRAALRWAQTTE
jgi:ABC-type antimicrobial peptide transport system permease subunit